MVERVLALVPEDDWVEHRVDGLPVPRSREELAYQRMFAVGLRGVPAALLGRFATA